MSTAGATGVLASLRDLPGVQGSFLVSRQGAVVVRDMPAIFGNDLLDAVGPRLVRLMETFARGDAEPQSFVVRFREHLLLLRNAGPVALCVLSLPGVNMAALRMGTNLAMRRLALLAGEQAETTPPTAATREGAAHPRAARPSPVGAAPSGRPALRWRGSLFEPKRH
jgi:predicted regulator of Ras-like GTPase activity (Roadblock/LC7/MglB family)